MEIMQAILNSKKVKYSVMEKLVKELPFDTEELNIFISADSIFKPFYNPKVNEQMNALKKVDRYLLSSEFINIIAHYRHFFYSRYSIPTNFFVYYSSKESSYCKSLLENYKESYYNKRLNYKGEFSSLNNIIKRNMELSILLSEYLPNIHIIDTETLEPSVLPYYIISKNGNIDGLTNLIITDNKLDFQLVNLDNTYILDLKSDDSRIISKHNLMDDFIRKSKIKEKTILDSSYFNAILSISGIKTHEVPGIAGMGAVKTISKLEKLSNDNIIDSNLIASAHKIFSEEDNIKIVLRNYKIISLENLYKNISPKEKYNIENSLRNKSDNLSLMEINNKYYQQYPLMLIELMEGEK